MRPLSSLAAGAVLAFGAAGSIAACGSDADSRSSAARVTAKPGSAEATSLTAFRLYQTSTWPLLAQQYDRRVVATLGSREMMNALVSVGGGLQSARVTKIDAERVTGSSLVSLLVRADGKTQRVSYTLKRSGGRWRILYDTLLADALPGYVQAAVALRTGERGAPSQEARIASSQVAGTYRAIFAPAPRDGRAIESGIRRGSPQGGP